MVDNNTKTQRVIFQTETGPVVIASDILKKYNLEESSEQAHKKIIEGEKPRVSIIVQGARDLVLNRISEREFISILEKELKITKEIAKKITKDVKERLLSIAKKITAEKLKTPEEKPILVAPIKPPIGLEKIKEGEITEPEIKKPVIPEKPEKVEETKKPVKKEIKKLDVYREPIE